MSDKRKAKHKTCSMGIFRVDIYGSAKLLGYNTADIKTQTDTLLKLIELAESLEDKLLLVYRHTDTGIGYGED